MKERRNEIGIHSDMLRAQIRAADDERQQISSELHERISKIDKLRKRYEILMVAMAPPEGEEEKSQAYYVIKVSAAGEYWGQHCHELSGGAAMIDRVIATIVNLSDMVRKGKEKTCQDYANSYRKL